MFVKECEKCKGCMCSMSGSNGKKIKWWCGKCKNESEEKNDMKFYKKIQTGKYMEE